MDVRVEQQGGSLAPDVLSLPVEGHNLSGRRQRSVQVTIRCVRPGQRKVRRGHEERIVVELPCQLDRLLGSAQDLVPAPALEEGSGRAVEAASPLNERLCASLRHEHQHPHLPRHFACLPRQAPGALCCSQCLHKLVLRHVSPCEELQATSLRPRIAELAEEHLGLGGGGQGLVELLPRTVHTGLRHQRADPPGARAARLGQEGNEVGNGLVGL
mmetsp:Transcript_125500/g.313530  ORF Transcript_125500/g.313530 Transcript_125500/m.313530 type:complete len:214 (-) Transcript_125500:1262-1903(-)